MHNSEVTHKQKRFSPIRFVGLANGEPPIPTQVYSFSVTAEGFIPQLKLFGSLKPSFLQDLSSKHPKITPSESHLCARLSP